jgi:hypothetical protein
MKSYLIFIPISFLFLLACTTPNKYEIPVPISDIEQLQTNSITESPQNLFDQKPSTEEGQNQSSSNFYGLESTVLEYEDFETNPNGTFTENIGEFELEYPDLPYTKVGLFYPNEGSDVIEVYGFDDDNDVTYQRDALGCDQTYTEDDTGNEIRITCEDEGTTCLWSTTKSGDCIILKCKE